MPYDATPHTWMIEFDFEADPDTSPDTVKNAVKDQISSNKNAVFDGNIVTVERVCDAFALKMLLGHHIVRAERYHALDYTG